MVDLFCCVCGTKTREPKELHYLGIVCSKCYRMSKKKYCELVDEMALIKIGYIMDEVGRIKTLHKEPT